MRGDIYVKIDEVGREVGKFALNVVTMVGDCECS